MPNYAYYSLKMEWRQGILYAQCHIIIRKKGPTKPWHTTMELDTFGIRSLHSVYHGRSGKLSLYFTANKETTTHHLTRKMKEENMMYVYIFVFVWKCGDISSANIKTNEKRERKKSYALCWKSWYFEIIHVLFMYVFIPFEAFVWTHRIRFFKYEYGLSFLNAFWNALFLYFFFFIRLSVKCAHHIILTCYVYSHKNYYTLTHNLF